MKKLNSKSKKVQNGTDSNVKLEMSLSLNDILSAQIRKAESLLLQVRCKGILASRSSTDFSNYNRVSRDIGGWEIETVEYLTTYFGEDSKQSISFQGLICKKEYQYLPSSDFNDNWNSLQEEIERCISFLNVLIKTDKIRCETNTDTNFNTIKYKPPKVFISHKIEDQDYADALISLINFIIGPEGDKLFCSSIPGYGIKLSHDIMDGLKAQFDNYEIYMIIIHSPRYYQSAVCLNEMGASWVLGTKFSSFMTKDCSYEQMHGVINRDTICVNLNDELGMLNSHLNDFKDDLISFFGLEEIDENKWENARGRFIKEVSSIKYVSTKTEEKDNLFDTIYLPIIEHVFGLLDIDNFREWAYPCAIDGSTVLKIENFDNLNKVVGYIKSRPRHKGYESWDALIHNLGILINDFLLVYSQHATQINDRNYYTERFYKVIRNNPNYDEDLEAYDQYVMLVSDIIFEIARFCNLIMSRIRDIYPDYKQNVGVLCLEDDITGPDLVYKENEISDAPYPGIEVFIKERLNRELHFGSNPNIDIRGYEKK